MGQIYGPFPISSPQHKYGFLCLLEISRHYVTLQSLLGKGLEKCLEAIFTPCLILSLVSESRKHASQRFESWKLKRAGYSKFSSLKAILKTTFLKGVLHLINLFNIILLSLQTDYLIWLWYIGCLYFDKKDKEESIKSVNLIIFWFLFCRELTPHGEIRWKSVNIETVTWFLQKTNQRLN